MHVTLADAAAQLPELVARADAGEEVVLTRDDAPSLRLVVDRREQTREEKLAALTTRGKAGTALSEADWNIIRERRRRALEEFRGVLKGKPGLEGVTAANITDDLYDEDGLPR